MNRQWCLATRPVGLIAESNFELRQEPVPTLEEGQILVRATEPVPGTYNFVNILIKRAKLKGFLVLDYFNRRCLIPRETRPLL